MKIFQSSNIYDNNFIFADRINTYVFYSEIKEKYFLAIDEGKNKNLFVSKIGQAILFACKEDQEIQEELVLVKEFLLKRAILCKISFPNSLRSIENFNSEQKAILSKLQFEQIRRLSISFFIKAKAKKLEKQAFIYSNHEEQREI